MKTITVTEAFLPPFDEYVQYLKSIWESKIVTNDGEFFRQLESEIMEHTKSEHVVLVANGTLALHIAIKALNLKGEVLTTPFTNIATSSSLFWENCSPVFVDIEPETLNIDPDKIEEKITEQTTAILPVHVYGNPCHIDAIEYIAHKHNLKVIYDAAHSFGSYYKDQSVFSYGDISITSFHATKAFHTIEGGAIFSRDREIYDTINRLRYFGINKNTGEMGRLGINAQMNEFSAIMGILNLKYFDSCTKNREKVYNLYKKQLRKNENIRFQKITDTINFSYFPIILQSKEFKTKLVDKLNENHIFPREYFSPSLETVYYQNCDIECKVAYDISKRILCLPLSTYLTESDVERICAIINEVNEDE